ncbi:NAD(P)/FAD-dependent oxidoreductase [Calditerrivibrio sp.]|uniref:NAD(P)/FAD-dependent oxidoreductase n=1 Tax=Calditerrivibrio sp. TaxID=2792612 RepID=UPI003D0BC3B3
MEKVVIVGGGPAGRVLVHSLYASKKEYDITLVKDEEINANRCAVPYGIIDKKPVEKFCIPNSLVLDFGAKLIIDKATEIDTANRVIYTDKDHILHYDHLLLATGSRPFIPDIEGVDLGNILTVRSKSDMETIRGLAKVSKRCVVVGGGYIGVEVAVVLKKIGLDVSIVEMLPHILLATMDDDFAKEIEDSIIKNGINVVTGTKVVRFEGDKVVKRVVLSDGRFIETDFVIVAVGVLPNTDLAVKSGIATSKYGIITDDYLMTNAPDVYAAGDCAEKKSFITGKPIRGEFGTNAVFMGKYVAKNILGKRSKFSGVINANVSTAFEYSFGSAGLIYKAALADGIDAVLGESEVMDMYPMMDGVSTIKTKLVFDRKTGKIIGGSVLRKGHCTASNVDFISFAIQMGATIEDILNYQYCTHPELAAKPSDNTYMFAAKDALKKI